jgi:regulator of RNase E activity RraA
MLWQDDDELFRLMKKELFSAVLGDILDKHEHRNQFLPPHIQPLREDMVVVGRAMTILNKDFDQIKLPGNDPINQKPYGLLFESLDDLKPNEVYVASGGSPRYALWGGLMSTRAIYLKSAGVVLDGYLRDTKEILSLNFPAFSHGHYAPDQAGRGKVVDFRVPVEIGGVRIQSGDIIYGDIDGVVIIPRAIEQSVIELSLEKVRTENLVKQALQKGMSTVDAFATYGVL